MRTIILLLFYSFSLFAQNSDIKLIDKNKLDSLVADRNGKILLVNFWATWCLPCKEEMPDLIQVNENYSESVEIVGISIDLPNEIETRVQPFIEANEINFKIFVNNFDKDEHLINYFNNSWGGALPATYIIDNNGILHTFIEGKTNYKELSESIKKIIK